MPRGGARVGAGRKKSNRHLVRMWLSNDEEEFVKKTLKKLRASKQTEEERLKELEKAGQGRLFEKCAVKSYTDN